MLEELTSQLKVFESSIKLWDKLEDSEETHSVAVILKCLAYHINNGRHEQGLTMYETYDASLLGVDEHSDDNYKYFKTKTEKNQRSYDYLFDKLQEANVIQVINKARYQNKEISLFGLTANGVIYSICFLKSGFIHSKEILDNFLTYSEQDEFTQNFRKLAEVSHQARMNFFESTYNIFKKFIGKSDVDNTSTDKEQMHFLSLLTLLPYHRIEFVMSYLFFFVSIYSQDKEVLAVSKLFWEDIIDEFRKSSNFFIRDNLLKIDMIEDKTGIKRGRTGQFIPLGYENGRSSFVIGWYSDKTNKWMEKQLSKYNISKSDLPRLYAINMGGSLRYVYQLIKNRKVKIINKLIKEQKELEKTNQPYTINLD